ALHGERLADHAARGSRKLRPVRPELKFHRDPGDHSQREADSKNSAPETGRPIVQIVAGSQPERLQDEDQQGKAHRKLRKDVVKRNGEGKVQAVDRECVPHGPSTRHERYSAHPLDAIAKTIWCNRKEQPTHPRPVGHLPTCGLPSDNASVGAPNFSRGSRALRPCETSALKLKWALALGIGAAVWPLSSCQPRTRVQASRVPFASSVFICVHLWVQGFTTVGRSFSPRRTHKGTCTQNSGQTPGSG